MKKVYETTDLVGLHSVFDSAILALNILWLDVVGFELHILHGLDGKHSRFSRHYQGCAIDVRTWIDPTNPDSGQIVGAARLMLLAKVRDAIGKNFIVIDHYTPKGKPTHFHISFKPTEAWTKNA